MLIPEAVSLVIQAGAMGKGGELFVLDMGEPVYHIQSGLNLFLNILPLTGHLSNRQCLAMQITPNI